MPGTNHVLLAVSGPIATITINNPAVHNSLGLADVTLFKTLLGQVEDNGEIRVLIITGAGSTTFCAGASLKEMRDETLTGELFETLTDRIAAVGIPTIASINGSVYGGGGEIALCCDFRIGVKTSRLRVGAATMGLCYPLNGLRRYVTRLGLPTANRILIAAEEFHAEQLLEIGYLTALVTAEDLPGKTRSLAEQIATLGPLATRTMKQIMVHACEQTLDQQQAINLIAACNQSKDLKEGLRAQKEKRIPNFHGH